MRLVRAALGQSYTLSRWYYQRRYPDDAFLRLLAKFPGPYCEYAYCIWKGAIQAKKLARASPPPAMSVIEFGVAGGNGLVAIERFCREIHQVLGVRFEVYGFDAGSGLQAPADYRDTPYKFTAGSYVMDRPALERRLGHAQLVIGDIRETLPRFLAEWGPAPIGAILFDLDFYSSTTAALRIFDSERSDEILLPRVYCYFDDITIPSVGELLAIHEFNAAHVGQIAIENSARAIKDGVRNPHKLFEAHLFGHREYCRPLAPVAQHPLAD